MLYTDLNTEIDVGASAHHVRFGPLNALVDCGMHPKLMGYPALPKLDLLGRGTLFPQTQSAIYIDQLPQQLHTEASYHT